MCRPHPSTSTLKSTSLILETSECAAVVTPVVRRKTAFLQEGMPTDAPAQSGAQTPTPPRRAAPWPRNSRRCAPPAAQSRPTPAATPLAAAPRGCPAQASPTEREHDPVVRHFVARWYAACAAAHLRPRPRLRGNPARSRSIWAGVSRYKAQGGAQSLSASARQGCGQVARPALQQRCLAAKLHELVAAGRKRLFAAGRGSTRAVVFLNCQAGTVFFFAGSGHRCTLRQSFLSLSPLGRRPAASCSAHFAACRRCFLSQRRRSAACSDVQLNAKPYASTSCCGSVAMAAGQAMLRRHMVCQHQKIN